MNITKEIVVKRLAKF